MGYRTLVPVALVFLFLISASNRWPIDYRAAFTSTILTHDRLTNPTDRIPSNWTFAEPGTLLRSPSGQYLLNLEPDGGLRLINAGNNRSIFWSNTGDGWDGQHEVSLQPNGVLRTRSKPDPWDHWQETWHSNLLPDCQAASGSQTPYLQVFDNGEMKIMVDGSEKPLCSLTQKPQDRMGRLALLVAGLYRTNSETCLSQVEKVIKTWPGDGVDVFWFTYLQDTFEGATNTSVAETVRACYGDYVKDVIVLDADSVEKPFPYKAPNGCGQWHIDRLNSQLKTVWLAGRQLQKYMLASGVRYEYVLRLRPDTLFWGDIEWVPLGGDNDHKIILPHPGREHYYYCSTPQGELTVGPTDQLAYGLTSDMLTWTDMYTTFPYFMMHGERHVAKRDYFGCEHLPDGPENEQCLTDVPCAVECFVGYYLSLRGIPFEISWRWGQNLLRRTGHQAKECEQGFDCP